MRVVSDGAEGPQRAEPSAAETAVETAVETAGETAVESAAGVAAEVTGGRCGVCRAAMRRGHGGVRCAGCGVVVHKRCCSLSRWEIERGETWRCEGCLSGVLGPGGTDAAGTQVASTAASDVLPAGKCDVCGRLRRRGQGIRCTMCQRVLHVKCGGLGSRGRMQAVDRSDWRCAECVDQLRERDDARNDVEVEVPAPGGREGGGSICVMQWNCDHLSSRIPELEVWLKKHDVDVAVIQESKLRSEDGDVRVKGFEVVRRDRWRGGRSRFSRGGGLVTLVRRGWAYREIACGVARDSAVEALSVEVVSPLGSVWRVMNVYVPPESVSGGVASELERLKVDGSEERWLVCGDFNAHHRTWDCRAAEDERGRMLIEWSADRNLVVLNDGAVTRCGRGTGVLSSPDVCFCSPVLFDELEWEVVRSLGSDHYPILVRSRCGARENVGKDGALVWDWSGARWEAYQQEVRVLLKKVDWSVLGVKEFECRLRNVVLTAAVKCVGKKRLLERDRLEAEVALSEMEARDVLRQSDETDWRAVAEAGDRVRERLKEARRSRWRDMLSKGASAGKMWSVVRGAKRSRASGRKDGEMLRVGDKLLVTARAKANEFVKVYERVSRVVVPRGRRMKARVNGILRSPGPEPGDCAPITVSEVRAALENMAEGKAAGPDDLHPRLLRMLPDEALSVVCLLFERSFRSTVVPQCWRVGEIVPLLKAGKDPSVMGSYRPVCLTSCLGKWLERVLESRMRWMLENAGWLSGMQAGFRKGRGVLDQLLRLSQSVWDGYQRREKTCLVLFDLARAFDRVWHDGLLLKLLDAGVGRTMVRWLQEWLKNRLYWVRVDGVRSKSKLFKQGLPQGSVLSPLLFLVYVNDLVERLENHGVSVSAFADDLAVWWTGRSVDEGRRRVQCATDAVADWCREWLMTLSVSKCTVTLLSNDVRDREMLALSVWLHGCELQREKNPRFLGVVYDPGFTFKEHVNRVVLKASAGVRLMRCLAGSDWGWCRDLLRTTYVALVRSVLLYGSAAWGPWVSATVWSMLERVQLAAARIIGGTLRSAPRESVLAEAGLCELRRVAETLWVCELEKCLRAPAGDLRREWCRTVVRKRLVRRTDWRTVAWGLMRSMVPEAVGRSGWTLGACPWSDWKGVEWRLDGVKSDDVESDRERAVAMLTEVTGGADFVVYTDGSAVEGVRCGGAAAVVTTGEPVSPVRVEVLRRAAGVLSSSFQAEVRALGLALEWLWDHESEWSRVVLVSDSLSALGAVKGAAVGRVSAAVGRVVSMGRALGDRGKSMLFVWVPGHRGLVGNEWADVAAGEAAMLSQDGVECMMTSIRSLCRRREIVEFEHERCRRVYGEGVRLDLEKGWERKDVVSLSRLRSGHSLELGAYRKRIGMEGTGMCRRCGEEIEESVEHVMSCVAGELKRVELGLSNCLSVLCCRPREALEYWRWWRRIRLK